jgi:cation diffusion facilitator family transporter
VLGVLRELIPFGHGHSHAEANVDTALETSTRGIWALKMSLVLLGVTAISQLVIATLSASVGLLADTIHNFGDALTAVPLWIAFSLARRKASRRHTYGLARSEDLAGVAIVLMILFSALVALYESIDRLIHPQVVSYLGWVIAAGLIGFLGNEAAAVIRIKVGREIGSAALIADGQHARVDGLTSLAVVFGALGVWLGFPLADPIVGILITLAILAIVKDTAVAMFRRMMDAIEPETVDRIESIAAAVDGVQRVDSVRARWHGHRIHADLQLVVDEDLPTRESHAIAERVRRDVFHRMSKIGAINVHVDPCGHSGVDHHRSTSHHELPAFTRTDGADVVSTKA